MNAPVLGGRQASKLSGSTAEVVYRYYELVDRMDYVALVALFDPDAVYVRPGYRPLRGTDQLLHFYQESRIIEHGHHELRMVAVDGPLVAVAGTFEGHLRDGRPIRQGFADFFTVTDGMITARETYFDVPAV